jgi:alkyl hydroperoxide reductase subunit D
MNIADKVDTFLEQTYPGLTSTIYRDLSLNFKKLLEEGPLEPLERFQNLLAASVALGDQSLMKWSAAILQEMGLDAEALRETAEVAGIMGMNNVYYKFRSYLPADVKENYTRAGLRMNSLGKHIASKKVFESMAMTVSVVNGCPMCIASHEKALITAGATADQIHELARLAATATGLSALKTAQSVL